MLHDRVAADLQTTVDELVTEFFELLGEGQAARFPSSFAKSASGRGEPAGYCKAGEATQWTASCPSAAPWHDHCKPLICDAFQA